MTSRRRVAAAAVAALLLVMAPAAEAQGPPGAPAALSVAPADVAFPTPADADFVVGWVDHGGVSVTVEPRNRNRANWQLFLQASAADMGGYGKPVQDLRVRADGSSTWVALSTTPILVAEGTGVTTVTVHFRVLLDLKRDDPGSYSVPLEYTATTF